eukprot:1646569-Alexandrium_andersonii.AAC.1
MCIRDSSSPELRPSFRLRLSPRLRSVSRSSLRPPRLQDYVGAAHAATEGVRAAWWAEFAGIR